MSDAPTQAEMLKVLLGYELPMFVHTGVYVALSSAVPQHPLFAEHKVAGNWVVEVYALHLRNLIDFLWNARRTDSFPRGEPRAADIHAGCFMSESDLDVWLCDLVPSGVRKWRDAADKRVMHMAHTRVDVEKNGPYPWPLHEIYKAIFDRWEWFRSKSTIREIRESKMPPTLIDAQRRIGRFRCKSTTGRSRGAGRTVSCRYGHENNRVRGHGNFADQ